MELDKSQLPDKAFTTFFLGLRNVNDLLEDSYILASPHVDDINCVPSIVMHDEVRYLQQQFRKEEACLKEEVIIPPVYQ